MVSYEMAVGLHRSGHDVSVLAPLQLAGDSGFDATLPLKVFRIKNIKDHFLKPHYHIFKMKQLMKKNDFDLIMAQSWYPSGIAAAYLAGQYRVDLTVTVHGNEILNPRFAGRYWSKKMRKVFNSANKIFCVSDYTRQKLRQRLHDLSDIDKKITIVHNGVDYNYFSPAGPDPELVEKYKLESCKVILTLARLVERKGQDMVIRALPEIKKHIPNVKYIICGRGSYESELRRLVAELELTGSVIFAGFIPNDHRIKYYNLCDIYIMPSREILEKGDIEGFGITYLEANACEKPVIGSKTGGAKEAIMEDESGFLADPENYNEIAGICVKLLSDHELSGKIGRKGRERVIREYNWGKICQRISEKISGMEGIR